MKTVAIAFYCRDSKTGKNGTAPIEASISINGQRLIFNTEFRCKPDDFKKKKKPAMVSEYLKAYTENFYSTITKLREEHKVINAAAVKDRLINGGRSYFIDALVKDYLMTLQGRVGISMVECVYRKYVLVLNDFIAYCGNKEIGDFVFADIEGYYNNLIGRYKASTASGMLHKVKTFFIWAVKNEYITHSPCNGLIVSKGTNDITFLTQEELNLIDRNYGIERLNTVRNIFLFLASTGLSYADYNKLLPEDIKCSEGVYFINDRRKKTGVEFVCVIMPKGVEIYKEYGLPKLSNQKLNAYLKEIQDLCGITTNLTCHLARRTYATMLLNSNVPVASVSKALGHTNTKTTLSSYAHLNKDTVISDIAKQLK